MDKNKLKREECGYNLCHGASKGRFLDLQNSIAWAPKWKLIATIGFP